MDVVPQGTAASNAPIGALDREFGFDPVTNGQHGTAFIQGMAAAGVTTVAKHFPGLGRVAGNTDFTSNVVDNVTTANDPYLNSFRAAVGAGVPMVMVALATYTQIDPTELAVFSPTVMRLLRNGLGFSGVIVSDDLGQAAAVQAIPVATRATGFLSRGRRPHHLAKPRTGRADGGRRCSPRPRGTPPSAPRWTPPRSGCSPPSRRPGCCRAEVISVRCGRGPLVPLAAISANEPVNSARDACPFGGKLSAKKCHLRPDDVKHSGKLTCCSVSEQKGAAVPGLTSEPPRGPRLGR